MIFERFCMLTEPPASVICELASPAPENLGTTFTGPTRPTIAAEASDVTEALDEPVEVAGVVVIAGVAGISGFAITEAVPVVSSDETPALALANAEAGNPPSVCAFSACSA